MTAAPLRTLAAGLCAAVAVFGFAFAAKGEILADFTLAPVGQGEAFTLSKARGKYVALHFLLKTECPVCLRYTHETFQGGKSEPDLVQVYIKPDEAAETEKWLAKIPKDQAGAVPPIHRDPDAALAANLGIPGGYQFHGELVHYPALVVVDPDGAEIFRYVGKSNTDRFSWEKLKAGIAADRARRAAAPTPAAQ